MFADARSKRFILVAHCLLNQNSISDGTADFPGQFTGVIDLLIAGGIGIVQLPCPELLCLGLDRRDRGGGGRPVLEENTRIRKLLEEEDSLALLRSRAQDVAAQVREYRAYGFEVLGLVGVNRSPSCGVETTTRDNCEVAGTGVFIEVLSQVLAETGQPVRMLGVKTSRAQESVERLRQFIGTLPAGSPASAVARSASPRRRRPGPGAASR